MVPKKEKLIENLAVLEKAFKNSFNVKTTFPNEAVAKEKVSTCVAILIQLIGICDNKLEQIKFSKQLFKIYLNGINCAHIHGHYWGPSSFGKDIDQADQIYEKLKTHGVIDDELITMVGNNEFQVFKKVTNMPVGSTPSTFGI